MADQAPTLEEVNDILTPSEDDNVLSQLTPEEAVIGAKILPRIAAQANKQARIDAAKKLDEQIRELKGMNEKALKEALDQIQKDATPPTPQEVEKLLSQEYVTIKFKVQTPRGDSKEREFVIGELPAGVEMRFVKALQQKIVPYLKELTSTEFRAGNDQAAKIQKFIEIVPDAIETGAELVAIVLNPRKEFDFVTPDWVLDNLNSYRMFQVILGQVAVNRIRDFFSGSYRAIRL